MNWQERVLRWIEPEDNPRNTIYGAIAAGLVIAAEDPTAETYPRVIAATVVAVATYWVAHAYAHWVADRFARPGTADASSRSRELADALIHEWPLAEGAAIPVIALLVTWATGAGLTVGSAVALATSAGALVMFELAGGLRRRLRPARLVANAAVGLVLGAALFAVKYLLH